MIDKGQWREFVQDTRVTPLLFTRSAMAFLMTTESQDLGLTSHPKDGAFWQYRVPVTILGRYYPHRLQGGHPPLASLTPLPAVVFPGGLPSRYWPAQPCIASVGNQSWAAEWYGCRQFVFIAVYFDCMSTSISSETVKLNVASLTMKQQ